VICNEQGNFDTALYWAEKALQLQPSDLDQLLCIYNNVELSYLHKNNTGQTLHYFHKIVDMCKDIVPSNRSILIPTYLNLGLLYEKQKNSSKALAYLFKVIDMLENILPVNYSRLPLTYTHIGVIYLNTGDYNSALFYLLKTFQIQQRILPAKHPNLVTTYVNLAIAYSRQSNDMEAYNSCQKALEIIGSTLDHPAHPITMLLLGNFNMIRENLSEALTFFHKALDAHTKSTSPLDLHIIEIYKGLGGAYMLQKNFKMQLITIRERFPLLLGMTIANLLFSTI
jgi:Tfp pilus assembly protein PilF